MKNIGIMPTQKEIYLQNLNFDHDFHTNFEYIYCFRSITKTLNTLHDQELSLMYEICRQTIISFSDQVCYKSSFSIILFKIFFFA